MEEPTVENFKEWINTTEPHVRFARMYVLVDYFKFLGGKPAKRKPYIRRKTKYGIQYLSGYPYVFGKRFEKWYFEVWRKFYEEHAWELAEIVNIYTDRFGNPVYFTKRRK